MARVGESVGRANTIARLTLVPLVLAAVGSLEVHDQLTSSSATIHPCWMGMSSSGAQLMEPSRQRPAGWSRQTTTVWPLTLWMVAV